MSTTKLLDEYILNPSGAIWSGNSRQPSVKPWNFGQVLKHAYVNLFPNTHLLSQNNTKKYASFVQIIPKHVYLPLSSTMLISCTKQR